MISSLNNPLETREKLSEANENGPLAIQRTRPFFRALVPMDTRKQRGKESGNVTNSDDTVDGGDHLRKENAAEIITNASSTPKSLHTKSSSSVFNGQPSIAAIVVLCIVTFAALLFLAIWYIRQRRRRGRYKRHTQNHDFGQSEITLAEDTSKTLDDFLMKEVPVERTSFMFSRSRSPSITFVLDGTENPGLSKQSHNSYGASTGSLSKLEPLTRISTDATRPSPLSSELTIIASSSQSTAMDSSCKPASSGSATPRASMSSSQLWTTITNSTECTPTLSRENPSTAPSTNRSSHVWTTTTASTETGSMISRENPSRQSNASRASSRLSGQGLPQGGVRLIFADNTGLKRSHARSYSRSSQNTVIPFVESSAAQLDSGARAGMPSNRTSHPPILRPSESG